MGESSDINETELCIRILTWFSECGGRARSEPTVYPSVRKSTEVDGHEWVALGVILILFRQVSGFP